MLNITKISDLAEKQNQDIFLNLEKNFGLRIIVIFNLVTQEIFGIYEVNQLIVPDESNKKNLFLKGKLLDLNNILQKSNWQYTIKNDIEILPISTLIFSENNFGFVGFGISSY